MNLSEVAAKLKTQQDELVTEWSRLATQGQTAHQAVVDTRSVVAHHEDQVRTELARITPAVASLQGVLNQGFAQIGARLDACEGQVTELKNLTQAAQQDLTKSSADMQEKSELLARSIPDVKDSLHKLLEEQLQLLDKDRQQHQAVQQKLQATLETLSRTVLALTGETDSQRGQAEAQIAACAERGANAVREISSERDSLVQQTAAQTQSYGSTLTEYLDSVLKPGTQKLGDQTVQGLHEQVLTPARSAVDDLRIRALEALEAQIQAQMPELTRQRKALDASLKELASGPQLIQLLKKAKPVLQRIGKLQALGLQNI